MKDKSFSNSIPTKHLILLYITSLGLYFFYWFYQTNKQLYQHHGINNKPILRTCGLIIPFLNIYLLWFLCKDIKNFAQKANIETFQSPGWLTAAFIFSSTLYKLPSIFSFIGFISVLPIWVIQKTLNRYWEKEQPHLPQKTTLSWQEILICCIGSIILILALVGIGLSPKNTT